MTSYAVFLRGVNVVGTTIKMAELRTALATLPVTAVRTLLASGNVACASELDPDRLKSAVETCLRENFGYDAWVVVLTRERLAAVIDACPYPADDKAVHSYVTLTSDPAALDALEEAGRTDTKLTRLGPEALAWLAPVGGTLDSPFSKISARSRFKSTTTTRNLRTLLKVRDALGKQ